MCRNIKTLFNFDPPATEDEIRAASLQFVRKLSGFNAPSSVAPAFATPHESVNARFGESLLALITFTVP